MLNLLCYNVCIGFYRIKPNNIRGYYIMPAKKGLDREREEENPMTTYAVRKFFDDNDDDQEVKKEKSKGKIQKTFYLPHDLSEMLRKAAYEKRTDQTKIVTDALDMYFKFESLNKK